MSLSLGLSQLYSDWKIPSEYRVLDILGKG